MMKFVAGAVFAAAFGVTASSGTAFAQEPAPTPAARVDNQGVYLHTDFGFHTPDGTFYNSQFENGFALNLAVGYRFRMFALETGIYEGLSHLKGTGGGNAGVVELLSIDGRWFFLPPSMGGMIEPNLLLGYCAGAGATAQGDDGTGGTITQTMTGYSTNVGIGARVNLHRHFFLDADVRKMFIRFTRGKIDDAGTVIVSGSTSRQLHGDDTAFLFGGGVQF
jgi:hypothetical protein